MAILPSDPLASKDHPRIIVVEITPDTARAWLERNIGNRPASPAVVSRYAKDMSSGQWKMTGDPIRFSRTGKLIDGQHRLSAIIQAGVTIQCVVMQDLADEIFDVLDSGKGRGKSDVLSIELGLPVETCKLLASSATLLIDYEREQFSFHGKAGKRDVMEFVQRNPSSIAAAEYAQTLPRRSPPVPRSIAAMFYFHASQRDQQAAARFLDRFMIGAVDGQHDCLLFLRNRCYSASVDRRPLHPSQVISALIRIWNAEQRGKPIKHPQNALRQDDTFPTFI